MRGEWRDRAACRGSDARKFFPERGETKLALAAKLVCAGCCVRPECLGWALRHHLVPVVGEGGGRDDQSVRLPGVWGGLSGKERERLRKALRVSSGPF